jgi:hypothetical protein
MKEISSPCKIDLFLETVDQKQQSTLRQLTEALGLRFAFVTRKAAAPGGLETILLSSRHLVPVRVLEGGRLDVRIVPLALVLSAGLREEPEGLECQLELHQSPPLVLRWPGITLAEALEDKAFKLLMSTCGFSTGSPERAGRPGFRTEG